MLVLERQHGTPGRLDIGEGVYKAFFSQGNINEPIQPRNEV